MSLYNIEINAMTPANLDAEERRIRSLIDNTYVDPEGKSFPIYDGVIDAHLYCSSRPRIMWILKEPWDEKDSSGGGWSLTKDLLAVKPIKSLSHSTFHPIIYIAYGLFNRVSLFDEMPWVRDMPSPESILRKLAFINAKKLPGVTQGVQSSTVMNWYVRGKAVVHRQIEAYQPDIVFGCAPHLPAILDDLSHDWRQKMQTTGSADCVRHGNTIFVRVYHPGQRQLKRHTYVDDALKAVALAR